MSFTGLSAPVDIGQPVTATFQVKSGGVLTDATLVANFDCIDPTTGLTIASVAAAAIAHGVTGTYTTTITPTAGGLWRLRSVSSGTVTAAQNGYFYCNKSPLTPP